MMDLDELERIATEAQRNTLTGVWEFKRDCSPEDVLALVRVAKVAQEWLDHGPGQSHCEEEDCPCTSTVCQLKKATAALSPDARERTDG